MKKLIIAASISAMFISAAAFAESYKCNQVYKGGEVIERPGKLVVKFTYPENLIMPPSGKVWYRGDLNGVTETLRVKTVVDGNNLGTYHLPGGEDADKDNNAPGSTYDPNKVYKESTDYMPGEPGSKLKLVFKLNDGDDASWAVVNKVKLFMWCGDRPL